MTWIETEYDAYLQRERRAYAWVMQHYGNRTPAESWESALAFYPYQPSDAPCRGLVFHDSPWHWAMSVIHGDRYMIEHPELADSPPEYDALR